MLSATQMDTGGQVYRPWGITLVTSRLPCCIFDCTSSCWFRTQTIPLVGSYRATDGYLITVVANRWISLWLTLLFIFLCMLQLKVNPDELVEELDFDNNVITCTLNYTGYNVSVRNCQLGRH